MAYLLLLIFELFHWSERLLVEADGIRCCALETALEFVSLFVDIKALSFVAQ